ncbi:MAG TPA: FAD-binding oxidoreductase [Thermomicrobiales bacterium]|nr:FAD-binding oxidoreductase [Thermomicrobiales bacterium]
MSIPQRTEVVVIGGGVIGTSIAYHLAAAGAAVTLLERRAIAAGASGASAGGVRQQGRDLREMPLAIRSIAKWATLEDELECDLDYRRQGHLTLIERAGQLPALAASVAEQRAAGLALDLVTGDDLRALAPAVSSHVYGGSYTAADGHANPMLTALGFAEAAKRRGAVVRTGVGVTGLAVAGGRVTGVETNAGPLAADVTVLAAGAWSAGLARAVGLALPLEPMGLQMLVTAPAPHCLDQVVGCVGRPLSLKQLPSGGFLIGGGWPGDVLLDRDVALPRAESVAGSAAVARDIVPRAGAVALERAWVGIEARAADDVPILGPVDGLAGLVVAAGFSGHGFALSPIVGQLIAELIVEGAPSIPLDALHLDRFAGATPAAPRPPTAG